MKQAAFVSPEYAQGLVRKEVVGAMGQAKGKSKLASVAPLPPLVGAKKKN